VTVYRPKGRNVFLSDFELFGERHAESTRLTTKREAEVWEKQKIQRLRERAAGVAVFDAADSPFLQDWAEVYLAHAAKTLRRPERVRDLLRVALQFWGRRPAKGAVDGAPYHDLRLGDVVRDPFWLIKYDTWLSTRLTARGQRLAGQTRNQYRSVVSQMFALASAPVYRSRTGVVTNPMVGLARDAIVRRSVTLSPEQIRAAVGACAWHVRLAIAIGVYASKLRLSNILRLEWGVHLDPELTTIVVTEHKGSGSRGGGKPLVVAIADPLRAVLQEAQRRDPRSRFVVTYRGRPVQSIRGGVRMGFTRAGLTYGYSQADGATFHTLRHAMATLAARLHRVDLQPALSEHDRMTLMGHTRMQTTLSYTHVPAGDELAAAQRMAAAVRLEDLVASASTARDGRVPYVRRRRTGKTDGTATADPAKAQQIAVVVQNDPDPADQG